MKQMARPEWDTPIAVLPNGTFVYASQVRQVRLSPRVKAFCQGLVLFAGFLLLCALASFDGVTP